MKNSVMTGVHSPFTISILLDSAWITSLAWFSVLAVCLYAVLRVSNSICRFPSLRTNSVIWVLKWHLQNPSGNNFAVQFPTRISCPKVVEIAQTDIPDMDVILDCRSTMLRTFDLTNAIYTEQQYDIHVIFGRIVC